MTFWTRLKDLFRKEADPVIAIFNDPVWEDEFLFTEESHEQTGLLQFLKK